MPGFHIAGSGDVGFGNSPSNTKETHRAHRWEILNFGFPSRISSTNSSKMVLRTYAKTCSLPSIGFDIQNAPGGSIDYPYAAKATFEPVTISFYDIIGIYPLFDEWRNAIWTPEDGIKMINDYAGEPVIAKKDGAGNITEKFTLKNAFPKLLTHSDLTYESSDILLVKVTFVFSHFEFESSDSIDLSVHSVSNEVSGVVTLT